MKVQRIQEIEHYIREKGAASIDELCDKFSVSKNTIRRDLKYILDTGDFDKVYGGIALKAHSLVAFEERQVANQEKKKLIAKKAATLIKNNDLIFIDSGTTTKYLIDYVPTDYNLTVVTNSLDVVNAAAARENIELIIVGSKFKSATRSFIELQNNAIIQTLNIKKAFMSATGITIQNGLTNSDMLETHLKKNISEKADKVYLLVDDSKFDRATLITYASLDQLKAVVSGGAIAETYLDYFKEHKITLYQAY